MSQGSRLAKLQTLLHALEEGPLEEEQVQKVHDATTAHLKQPETQEKLLEEARKLASIAGAVDTSFRTIQLTLSEVDIELDGEKMSNGKPFEKYAPGWTELRNKWTELFWKARDNAISVQTFIKEFQYVLNRIDNMMDEQDDTKYAQLFQENSKSLQDFLAENKPTQGSDATQHFAQALKSLSEEVDSFRSRMTQTMAKEVRQNNNRLDTLKEEVDSLDKEIASTSDLMYKIGQVLSIIPGATILDEVTKTVSAVTEAVGSLGLIGKGLSCLSTVGPVSVLGAVTSGLKTLFDAQSDFVAKNVDSVDAQIALKEKKLAEIKAITSKLEVLTRVKEELGKHELQLDEISHRFLSLNDFQPQIYQDAEFISQALKQATSGRAGASLAKKITLSKVSYDLLYGALKAFVLQADTYQT